MFNDAVAIILYFIGWFLQNYKILSGKENINKEISLKGVYYMYYKAKLEIFFICFIHPDTKKVTMNFRYEVP